MLWRKITCLSDRMIGVEPRYAVKSASVSRWKWHSGELSCEQHWVQRNSTHEKARDPHRELRAGWGEGEGWAAGVQWVRGKEARGRRVSFWRALWLQSEGRVGGEGQWPWRQSGASGAGQAGAEVMEVRWVSMVAAVVQELALDILEEETVRLADVETGSGKGPDWRPDLALDSANQSRAAGQETEYLPCAFSVVYVSSREQVQTVFSLKVFRHRPT